MSQVQPPQDATNSSMPVAAVGQGSMNAVAHGYSANSPSDEIDLVELMGFFWKIKTEIVLGMLVGVIVGAGVALKFMPVTYRTQIPLVLDKAETAAAEPKKMAEAFNNALNSSDNARQIWRSVFNQSPELARELKEANLNDESLAANQALADKPEKAPLRLRESASPRDFVLDVQLPVQGLSPRSGELFASAIQMAFNSTAAAADVDKDVPSKPTNANAPGAAPVQVPLGEESTEIREQLLKTRQELLKIEYLCSKLARGLAEAAPFLVEQGNKPIQVALPPNTELPAVYEVQAVQVQFERIQRMVAVLLAEGRMKPEDANDTTLRAIQLRDDIIQLLPNAHREAVRMFKLSQQKRGAMLDDNRIGMSLESLPVLVPATASGSTLRLEEPVSKRKIAPVLGAFLGAFAGFAFGGLRVFLRKNGQRLREVLAQ